MNFEKNFSQYNKHAFVQKKVAEKLTQFLPQNIDSYEDILELGCGTGFFTREFLKKSTPKNLFLNDFFDTEKYLKDIEYKEFLRGDMKDFLVKKIKKYDLIISSSCFQWENDLELLIKLIAGCTNNLVFSIYLAGNMKEIKNHFGVGLKYYTKNEIIKILKKYFKNIISFEEEIVLEFPTPFEALRHIKNTGTSLKNKENLSTISKIKSYKETKLTYKIGYFYVCN